MFGYVENATTGNLIKQTVPASAIYDMLLKGSWSPSININTLLLTIRVLMRHPNVDDGLVPSIVSFSFIT